MGAEWHGDRRYRIQSEPTIDFGGIFVTSWSRLWITLISARSVGRAPWPVLRLGMIIRPAVDADLDAILAIHNDAILNSTALWTDDVVPRSDREEWLASRTAAGDAVLVAMEDDQVAGYAAYAPWRAKYGYRNTVEDSVYLAAPFQGRGFGRSLLLALIEHARTAGHHVMLADIESGNAASIRLHESLGFVEVGRLREIGTKFDRWLDLTILQLDL